MVAHARVAEKPFSYQRHRPEQTVLYKIVQENLKTFLAQVHEELGHPLPEFVEKEFYEYLECGILAHGFLRARCEDCHKENLIAFSCKKRGFCPSCCGRRMSESAIHLVDEVLPIKPIRQWVLSSPFQLRLLLAIKPNLMAQCLEITNKCIFRYLCKKAGIKKSKGKTGSVTLIQRFGGSLNLNLHFHQLYIDGVYELDEEQKPSHFQRVLAPTKAEVGDVLQEIVSRVIKLLEKQGLIDENFQIEISDDDAFSRLQAGSVSYRFATGPNKGKKALTLKTVGEQDHVATNGLVAKNSGFSLHAGVSVNGDERKKLEKICRYIARGAIAQERLSLNERGQVVYKLKRAYDDGTTHLVMEPLELLEKLAALVPRPRVATLAGMRTESPFNSIPWRFGPPLQAPKSYRAKTKNRDPPGHRSHRCRSTQKQSPHVLGKASQACIQYRHGNLPGLWWQSPRDRSNRRSHGHSQNSLSLGA